MFKDYLKNIAIQLQNHSETVKTKNILVGKPWALIDGDHEMQKLIFESEGTLILSLNGQAKIGKWRYLPEAKSLLIDRVTDQILCNYLRGQRAIRLSPVTQNSSKSSPYPPSPFLSYDTVLSIQSSFQFQNRRISIESRNLCPCL